MPGSSTDVRNRRLPLGGVALLLQRGGIVGAPPAADPPPRVGFRRPLHRPLSAGDSILRARTHTSPCACLTPTPILSAGIWPSRSAWDTCRCTYEETMPTAGGSAARMHASDT